MESKQFFVSVIIPVYNEEAFLAEAVESIQRQAYEPLEIIVVDDGSTDSTAQIAASFKGDVHYVFQTNSGPAAARNRGLRIAHGNVISFLDADDLWSENKLELQLARLADDPPVEIVLGYTQFIRISQTENGEPKFEKHPESWPAPSLGSAVIRSSAFGKVGFFDQTLPFNDDVDWFLRAKELGISIALHQEVTQFYRRHERNITNQRELNQSYFIKAIKKSLDRRRQEDGIVVPMLKWFKLDV